MRKSGLWEISASLCEPDSVLTGKAFCVETGCDVNQAGDTMKCACIQIYVTQRARFSKWCCNLMHR